MPKLPEPLTLTTAAAIVQWYAKTNEDPRPHLGCSEIGRECDRALWYNFRWATRKVFDPRIKRLFKTGQREEARFLEELKGIGAEVVTIDPATNKQVRFVGYKGHFSGSSDGIGRKLPEGPKTWAVIEMKTHGDKSFKELLKSGVEKSKPEHFVQMQMYMGFAQLPRALYLACNKNTDELYSEWIHFDKQIFDKQCERAAKIIDATEPPVGISTNPAWYQCKMCDHQLICQGEQVPAKSCRTCVHSTPVDDGAWNCGRYETIVSYQEQLSDECPSHLFIPSLINYATPTDGSDEFILYQDKESGLMFANVTEEFANTEQLDSAAILLTSKEVIAITRAVMADGDLQKIKKDAPDIRITQTIANPEIQDETIPF